MDLSCKRGGWAALMAVLVLLTLSLLPGRAESGLARRGGSPPSQVQRQEGQVVVPESMIQFHEGLLSVRIRNAPWDDVLQAIKRQAGVMIQVQGQLAGTLSLEFESLPLQQGLRRLFRDANALHIHTPRPQEGSIPKILIRVWIFPQAGVTEAAAAAGQEAPDSLDQTADATPHAKEAQRELEPATEDDQDERLTALHAFHHQGNIEALQQAVFDPDQTIQATALELLATQDRQAASDALVHATRSEQSPRRLQALSLLHQTDQADELTVLSALEEALADHEVMVKSYAIQALAERGGADALEVLRQALRDPDIAMKKIIIEKVAQTAQGHSLLQEALSDDDTTIRSLAAFWLEEATLKEKASRE